MMNIGVNNLLGVVCTGNTSRLVRLVMFSRLENVPQFHTSVDDACIMREVSSALNKIG